MSTAISEKFTTSIISVEDTRYLYSTLHNAISHQATTEAAATTTTTTTTTDHRSSNIKSHIPTVNETTL
jgi:hypothetical protein